MLRASYPHLKTDSAANASVPKIFPITGLNPSSSMNRNHQPFNIESGKSDLMILYIHGIMGSPLEFRRIADALNSVNYHGKALLLPGHGGSGYNFAVTQPHAWQDHVNRSLAAVRKENANIILIGHSLGGLLALQASLQVPVEGIVLINTPIRTRISFRQISLSLQVLFRSRKSNNPLVSAYRESFSVSIRDFWSLPLWIPRLLDIRRIAKKTMTILNEVTVPVIIFQSRPDETVKPDSADVLKRGLGAHVISLTYLHTSTHAYFEIEEFNQIIMGIKRLIDLTVNK